jgi:hypothetical protein
MMTPLLLLRFRNSGFHVEQVLPLLLIKSRIVQHTPERNAATGLRVLNRVQIPVNRTNVYAPLQVVSRTVLNMEIRNQTGRVKYIFEYWLF